MYEEMVCLVIVNCRQYMSYLQSFGEILRCCLVRICEIWSIIPKGVFTLVEIYTSCADQEGDILASFKCTCTT